MNSDILGILNSTDQWYNSPQDCARSRRPMMREQASLDTFWWSFFFFFPTDFSVTRDVLPDSSAIACFSRMSQLSLQKQENSQVCPCRLHQCMPWLSEASAILCSSLYAFLVLADNDGCDSWSLQSDPAQKYSSSFHSDSRWFQISTSEKVPPLSCTTHPFPIFVLDILDILPWPAFPAESFLTLIWATTICWSGLCGRDTFFLPAFLKDEAIDASAHMIQGHSPVSMSGLLGAPTLTPPLSPGYHSGFWNSRPNSSSSSFWTYFEQLPCQGAVSPGCHSSKGSGPGPPPMEGPPQLVLDLSSCCPAVVFHLRPESWPPHSHCPDSVTSRLSNDSQKNQGPLGLVGEHLSSSVNSIGLNTKVCCKQDHQWLFYLFIYFSSSFSLHIAVSRVNVSLGTARQSAHFRILLGTARGV